LAFACRFAEHNNRTDGSTQKSVVVLKSEMEQLDQKSDSQANRVPCVHRIEALAKRQIELRKFSSDPFPSHKLATAVQRKSDS
jgi:hypothetical protein